MAPPRLLLVHGAGGTSRGWDPQRLAFPGAVAPDLPGHAAATAGGGTAAGRPGAAYRRIEDYAEWLRATAHAHGWLPAVLAGHSMGGAIALTYALSWPDDLVGIVLIATGARLRVAPEILTGIAADYPAAVETIIARSVSPSADPRLVRRLREAMLAVPAVVTAADFQACDAFDMTGRLDAVRAPALIIAGREDRMTPPRYAEYLQAHLPRSRLVWISGAGHMVHVERPREVNEAIRGFLAELAGRAPR